MTSLREIGRRASVGSEAGSMSSLASLVVGVNSLKWTDSIGSLWGSFRATANAGESVRGGRRLSSLCADQPDAMLPRIVQECNRHEIGAGWIARIGRSRDPRVQRCAASIYSSVSVAAQAWLVDDSDDNKLDELARVLLALGASDNPDTRIDAKTAIVALAKWSEEFRAALVQHEPALKVALVVLTKSDTQLLQEKRLAAVILRYLIGSQPSRECLMHGSDLLTNAVASVLRIYDDLEISTQMSFVFADISRDPETRKQLDSEFIGALQHMIKGDETNQTLQINAVKAVCNVASVPELKDLLLSMHVERSLVRLASSQWEEVRSLAVKALQLVLPEKLGPASSRPEHQPEPEPDVPQGTIPEEEIEFRGRLGEGACGEVFRAKWRGSDVAVKCMLPQQSERRAEHLREFRNEVQLLMQARHPNIVLLMGTLETDSRLAIVTELCAGSLYHVLHSRRSLPWKRRLQMAQDAARGCLFLHSHQPCIVHLDLKSLNLLVDKNYNLKVADFGLAQMKKNFYVGQTGMVGTPEWTAPEVLKEEPFNESADVYSFGVVLWEMATRQRPFKGMLPHQVMAAVGFNGQQLPRPSGEQSREIPEGYVELMYNWCVQRGLLLTIFVGWL